MWIIVHIVGKTHTFLRDTKSLVQNAKTIKPEYLWSALSHAVIALFVLLFSAFIVSELSDIVCTEHDEVNFSCQVYRANVSAKWFKNDVEIISTANTDKYLVNTEDKLHRLTFRSLEMDDSGTYSIAFDNNRSSSAKLDVHGKNKMLNTVFVVFF